jgi:hypothetical protein
MWLFKSKKQATPVQISPVPMPEKEEIELIPEELPPLEGSMPVSTIQVPSKGPVFPEIPEEREMKVEIIKDKFIKTAVFNDTTAGINSIQTDFANMDFEIARVVQLKSERDGKIDALQDTLEEIGKKLMHIEQTIFGGAQ